MTPFEREKLETLDGSRGNQARSRAAVRLEDLAGLLELPPRLQAATAAGATPTAAEFNALVTDVTTMNNRLQAVIAALQERQNS